MFQLFLKTNWEEEGSSFWTFFHLSQHHHIIISELIPFSSTTGGIFSSFVNNLAVDQPARQEALSHKMKILNSNKNQPQIPQQHKRRPFRFIHFLFFHYFCQLPTFANPIADYVMLCYVKKKKASNFQQQ